MPTMPAADDKLTIIITTSYPKTSLHGKIGRSLELLAQILLKK
jgi:hypothetical protein